ncbi:hypothetical protein [Streptosporangium sp. NBC_01756]|nr:hypothetical protein [Streptosporangium sp. NBC_01756]WSC86941.1 hypothetical protein OIE48_01580 [Streptosporangium sp. NBC_01756]
MRTRRDIGVVLVDDLSGGSPYLPGRIQGPENNGLETYAKE